MFSCEDGAWSIIDDAVKKYEQHFHDEFPIYEYIDVTRVMTSIFYSRCKKISEIH